MKRWSWFKTSTWFLGFQTTRTYVAPWMWKTDIFIIPGIGIGFQWGWHCDECRAGEGHLISWPREKNG